MRQTRRAAAWLVIALLVISMVPVTSESAASAPKLNKTKVSVNANKSTTLTLKNLPRGSAVTWSSSNKKAATVKKSGKKTGKVTGVKAGTAKITAKVKTGKKTYTLKCSVTVMGSKTVSTQKELKAALKSKVVNKIVLKSSAETTFTVPKGSYKKIALVVDTPNADVVNSGVFKSIKIKAIKEETFTEKAKGNKITVTASAARIVVDSVGQAENIAVEKTGSNIAIVVNGGLNSVLVDVPATVTITGETKTSIPVTVSENAGGAVISADTKVDVSTAADIALTLEGGAVGSTVTVADETLKVDLTNNTGEDIAIEVASDETDKVESGNESGASSASGKDASQSDQERLAALTVGADGSLTIPDSVTSIPDGMFRGKTSIKRVTIPSGVTSIGKYAFKDCTALTSIEIPDSVTSIGDSAFSGCTALKRATIQSGTIGAWAFGGCTGLSSVTMVNVKTIEHDAFYGCTMLTTVTIPDSVTSIGSYAFYGCTSLSSVKVNQTVYNAWGEKAFDNCSRSLTINETQYTEGER